MNSLVHSVKGTQRLIKIASPAFTAVRNHWNKDYKPTPFPTTPEERAASASKYGLPVSEYRPYPDNGMGAGDYPDIPIESGESRDPYYPWDNPELKRNYNELLHEDFDTVREDRYNINNRFLVPLGTQWLQFFGTMGGATLLWWIFEHVKMYHAVIPPQYPEPGKVHYTFEQE